MAERSMVSVQVFIRAGVSVGHQPGIIVLGDYPGVDIVFYTRGAPPAVLRELAAAFMAEAELIESGLMKQEAGHV